MMKGWLFTASLVLALALWLDVGGRRIKAQEPSPTPTPGFLLSDDVMPPTGPGEGQPSAAASDYKVTPVLFVAKDLTPNPFALQFIDKKMQLIQRWYGEQLRGLTFGLQPAQLVIGSQPLNYYYGDCYPPTASCDPAYNYLWPRIFADLSNLGYPWQSNRVLGVFFQNEGVGGLGLGTINQFLVGLENYLIFEDCFDVGCTSNLGTGITAHEFGHTFNLVHPTDDPEGSFGKSVMGVGFYFFPQCTLVNTSANPERDILYVSPFFNTTLPIKNGGFEDCLKAWTISSGAAWCRPNWQRSGLSALQLSPNGDQNQVRQDVSIQSGQTYDFSGWLRIIALAQVGFYDTPDYALEVVVRDDYAYVADAASGLRILNISNLTAPTEVGFYDTPDSARDIALVGNYAYVADWFNGLRILDISNPITPTEVGVIDTPWAVDGVAAAGNYAYVADGFTGLGIINVSNPASPILVRFYDTPSLALDVVLAGNYAYVADLDSGLHIINIANPAAPFEAGFYNTPGQAMAVAVRGNYAYVADNAGGLRIINIANPAAPFEVGFYDTPGAALGVAIAGSYAYVADGGSGLRIINISNPAAPIEVGASDTPGTAEGLAVIANRGFVANGDSGLSIINLDLSNQIDLQIQAQALSASGAVLSNFDVTNYEAVTTGWERFGRSMTMPAGATQARLQITAQGSGHTVHLDDLDFRPAQQTPPAPLPMFYSEGDVVPTHRPTLKWSEVTAATSFRLQVASDRTFNSLVANVTTVSPFYTLRDDLAYNRRYFWRVRAMNGAGQSDWSPRWSFIPRSTADYYNEEFETNSLSPAWSWVREAPDYWGFGGPPGLRSYGYFYLVVLEGSLHNQHNAKNLLLQPVPAGDFEVSTFFITSGLNSNMRQAGLLIYQDDNNYLKLIRIYEDGYKLKLQAVVSQTVVAEAAIPLLDTLPIKIARHGNTYSGYYSTDDVTWQSLGQPLTVNWPQVRMGLVAFDPYHDPIDDDPNQRTQAYFDWFRVRPGCTKAITTVYPPASGTVIESAGDCDEGLGHSAGFTITLTANPSPGYQFISWSAAITGTTNPISLTISHDITVTATFSQAIPKKEVFLPIIYRQ